LTVLFDACLSTADSDADEEDHVLLEIFSSEVETHLATIRHFIGWMDQEAPLYQPPTDDLQRALHTLKGSAKMAQVTPVAQLYTVLESFAKELVTFQVSVTPDVLQLKRDAISYTETALAQIAAREPVYIKQLDQFLARTAELRELSVGQLVKMKDQQKDGERPVDPRLLSIFMAEEMNLLLDADEIVEAWCSGADAPVLDLVTELDTLATGADTKMPILTIKTMAKWILLEATTATTWRFSITTIMLSVMSKTPASRLPLNRSRLSRWRLRPRVC